LSWKPFSFLLQHAESCILQLWEIHHVDSIQLEIWDPQLFILQLHCSPHFACLLGQTAWCTWMAEKLAQDSPMYTDLLNRFPLKIAI
jgi:hypothetical protein